MTKGQSHKNIVRLLFATMFLSIFPGNISRGNTDTIQPLISLNYITIGDSVEDPLAQAKQLYSKGVNYCNASQESLALLYFNQCYELCNRHSSLNNRKIGVSMIIAKTQNTIGEYKKAINSYKKCLNLSTGVENLSKHAAILNNIGNIYFNIGILDSSEIFFQNSIFCYEQLDDSVKISIIQNNIGNIAFQRGDYQTALNNYLLSAKIRDQYNEKHKEGLIYSNIASVYEKMERPLKALKYYQLSLSLDSAANNQIGIASTLVNIGNVHLSEKQNNKAIISFQRAFSISSQHNYLSGLANSLEGISLAYCSEHLYDSTLIYLDSALVYKLKTGNPSELSNIYNSIGAMQFYNKQFNEAILSFRKSINLASEGADIEKEKRALFGLSESYAKTEDYKNAYTELIRYQYLNDSIWGITKSKQIFELQEKYESEKKEQQIKIQKLEIIRKIGERNLAVVLAVFILLVAVFIMRLVFLKRKREQLVFEKEKEIQKHQLMRLIQESELKASRMMIEGQELEKEHISKELHDRIGGLLSLLKLRFTSLQKFVPQEHLSSFNASIELLDTTYHEVRNFSHELSGELLSKFGLTVALKELQKIINKSGTISLQLKVKDNLNIHDSFVELSLYRIIQELVSNVLKHAQASFFAVSVNFYKNGAWSILVEDNGIGFDVKSSQTYGLGLMNVEERIHHLNAEMIISSTKNNGTSISIVKKQKYS